MKEALDKALAREDICPRCLGELDTGWECTQCGYDASGPFVPPQAIDRLKKLVADAKTQAPPAPPASPDPAESPR